MPSPHLKCCLSLLTRSRSFLSLSFFLVLPDYPPPHSPSHNSSHSSFPYCALFSPPSVSIFALFPFPSALILPPPFTLVLCLPFSLSLPLPPHSGSCQPRISSGFDNGTLTVESFYRRCVSGPRSAAPLSCCRGLSLLPVGEERPCSSLFSPRHAPSDPQHAPQGGSIQHVWHALRAANMSAACGSLHHLPARLTRPLTPTSA